MSYFKAAEALEDENTPIEQLLDCLIALTLDRGYILASVHFGRRTNADADILRLVVLSKILKIRIASKATEVKDSRSIGSDRSVVKYLKRKTH